MTQTVPRSVILGTGSAVPSTVVTNDDLARIVDTSDEWITTRTGIKERRVLEENQAASDLALRASERALEDAGIAVEELDAIICGTCTADYQFPSLACVLEAKLGAREVFSFDVNAACSGFLNALSVTDMFVRSGRIGKALVVGTDVLSRFLDWQDRSTCILFGDGAGAAVVQPSTNGEGILSSYHSSDGGLAELITRPAGGAALALTPERLRRREHMLQMSGPAVFKAAVKAMAGASAKAMQAAGLEADDIDLLVPHQANARIIEATARYARMPMDRVFVNLHRYGNISSATIPVGLDEAVEQGRIGPGSHILMAAFGAGLTWGAMAMRW